MRVTTYRRTVAELAIVRSCALENLQDISQAIRQLGSGLTPQRSTASPRPIATPPAASAPSPGVSASAVIPVENRRPPPAAPAPAKKNLAPEASDPERRAANHVSHAELSNGTSLTPENVREIWRQAVADIGDMAASAAEQFREIAILAPNHLVVHFAARYKVYKDLCERPETANRIGTAIDRLTGSRVRVEFAVDDEPAAQATSAANTSRALSPRERLRQVATRPLVQRACEVFGGTLVRVEDA
jgi:hypothetical protein